MFVAEIAQTLLIKCASSVVAVRGVRRHNIMQCKSWSHSELYLINFSTILSTLR